MSTTLGTTRPRRRLAISLRWLMVVVLMIGLGLGWVRHRIKSQREAFEAVVGKEGGFADFDFDDRFVGKNGERGPIGPTWLSRILGNYNALFLFRDVIEVHFVLSLNDDGEPVVDDESIDDSLMPYLARFSKLQSLDLDWPHRVTGSGLGHIRDLTKLEVLKLSGMPLKDSDLSHFSNLNRLRILEIGIVGEPDTGIGDEGLRHLAGLSNLEELELYGHSHISDAGLAHLAGLTKLKWLNLDGSRVTDAGLVHLRGLTNLTRLYLSGTKVTDEGMAELTRHQHLEDLDISRTAVTEAGIHKLKTLPKLNWQTWYEDFRRSEQTRLKETEPRPALNFH